VRRVAVIALIGFATLATPPAAGAHLRSGVVAEDYLASAAPLGPLAGALSLRIYKTDRALALTVRPSHHVTVIGYLGEPFIRVSDAGVLVDETSPTAAAAGLVRRPSRARGPNWVLTSPGRRVVWHTASLRGLPHGIDRAGWQVPLVVDGRRTALRGLIWRVPAPSLWPWLLLGAPFALAVLALVGPLRSRLRSAVVALGALAGAATATVAAAFVFAGSANEGRWVEGAHELGFVLVGAGVLVRGKPNARMFAAGGLGLLALAVGLSKVPVLLHGVVLSAFPATLTRLAVAAAVWTGAAASILGLIVFFDLLEEPDPAAERVRLDNARGS
jgi:hypothetical protein